MMEPVGTTRYFDGEGRAFMRECVERAFEHCATHPDIRSVVMFTGNGEGPHFAATSLLPRARYKHVRLVAVTPPFGKRYIDPIKGSVHAGIAPEMRDELGELGIAVIAAHLPFQESFDGSLFPDGRGRRSSPWTRVSAALGILGGGLPLAIQAIMMACDAGEVEPGELVVALTADTAITATACRTESFLSPVEGLLVEEILCRPRRYPISKRHHRSVIANAPQPQPAPAPPAPALPAATATPLPPASVEKSPRTSKKAASGEARKQPKLGRKPAKSS